MTKIRLPNELKDEKLLEKSTLQEDSEEETTITTTDSSIVKSRLGKKHELKPVSKYLEKRESYLLPMSLGENPTTGLIEAKTIYETSENENVLELEVFKNYMAILVEKDGQRQIKSVNLKTDNISTHYFDSPVEVCPANGQVSEFFNA